MCMHRQVPRLASLLSRASGLGTPTRVVMVDLNSDYIKADWLLFGCVLGCSCDYTKVDLESKTTNEEDG